MLVGRGRPFGDMLDETSLKFPFQYLYFVIEECPGAFADKQPDDGRTQIGYLLIGVAHNLERIEDVRLTFVGKVGQQQVLRFLRSENLQFVGIFDIHHLVADVICRFYQVDKRVTCVLQR